MGYRRRCTAITARGTRCSFRPMKGTRRCSRHPLAKSEPIVYPELTPPPQSVRVLDRTVRWFIEQSTQDEAELINELRYRTAE